MGQEERDRLKVLHEVEEGHLKQREAALQLGMSERGFRKLLRRYRKKGDRAVVHGLRGKKSNQRLDGRTAARAVKLVQSHYRDFGPTLASEYLEEQHGLVIEPGEVAATAGGRRDVGTQAAGGKQRARVAATAKLLGRDVAVGHQHACLAGGSGPREDVPDLRD